MQPALKNEAPEETMAVAQPSGWITEYFDKILVNFIQHARTSAKQLWDSDNG